MGNLNCPFTLAHTLPYQELPVSSTEKICDISLGLLTVVEKADSPDPLKYIEVTIVQVISRIYILYGPCG